MYLETARMFSQVIVMVILPKNLKKVVKTLFP